MATTCRWVLNEVCCEKYWGQTHHKDGHRILKLINLLCDYLITSSLHSCLPLITLHTVDLTTVIVSYHSQTLSSSACFVKINFNISSLVLLAWSTADVSSNLMGWWLSHQMKGNINGWPGQENKGANNNYWRRPCTFRCALQRSTSIVMEDWSYLPAGLQFWWSWEGGGCVWFQLTFDLPCILNINGQLSHVNFTFALRATRASSQNVNNCIS